MRVVTAKTVYIAFIGLTGVVSYLLQVGHQLVEAYAACTALPLVRRRLVGGSRHQEMAYQITEGDEVEDLYALLAFCKVHG